MQKHRKDYIKSGGLGVSLMAVTSFEVDERTLELLERLRGTFGVKTNAAVIRKALALANIASRHADADHTITIAPNDPGQPAVKISLAG